MTISTFANEHRQMHDWMRVPPRRAYREQKRMEAEERQAAFDAEVARTAREQNCGLVDARYVVKARRRHEHRTGRPSPITLVELRDRVVTPTPVPAPDLTGEEHKVPPCPRCGSPRWVSVSLDGGWSRRAQCVPCGRVHVALGPGWKVGG